LESGAKQKESVKGRQVVIVGGGDAAFENALILADFASRIILVHRKESFRSRSDFVEQALKLPNIEVVTNAMVDRIVGDGDVEGVEIRHLGTGRSEILRADNVLIRIGVSPNSEIVRGIVDLDSDGYIRVDYSCETSTSGICAVGDVANPISPTINSAAGMAATAAKSIESWLKAQKPL
jgi:thioredoxin reductase (NADPH)